MPLPRSVTPQLLTVPGRLASAVHGVGTILDRVGADVLVGFGGYVATPAYLAAKRHKVPIVVHEANPLAGIANRLGAHLTTHVFTGHPDTKLRNSVYLGMPIRRQIAELDRFALGDKARAHFGLRPDLPVLLVFGGSQGAMSLNRALAGAVGPITSAGVQVLHVTGPKHLNEITPPAGPVPYVALPYVDRMDLAYAAADFALCRAGAMTCAELTAVGLPAAYVPLPIGNGEQRLNALPIVQRGGGLLVDDAELTAEWIKSSLLPVLTNIDQVAGMSEAAAALGRKDADRWLAKAVIDIVTAEAASRAVGAASLPLSAAPPCRPARPPGPAAGRRAPPSAAAPAAAAVAVAAPAGQPVHAPHDQAAAARQPVPAGERPVPDGERAGRRVVAVRRPGGWLAAVRSAGAGWDSPRPGSRQTRGRTHAVSSRRRVRRCRVVRRRRGLRRTSLRRLSARRLSPRRLSARRARPHRAPDATGRRGYRTARSQNGAVIEPLRRDARDGAGDAHRTGAARGARAGALRRHRRRGDVRHRPDHAGQRRRSLRQ